MIWLVWISFLWNHYQPPTYHPTVARRPFLVQGEVQLQSVTSSSSFASQLDTPVDSLIPIKENEEDISFLLFQSSLQEIGWDEATKNELLKSLHQAGLSAKDLLTISRDLSATDINRMLIDDFSFPALRAHQLRTTVVRALSRSNGNSDESMVASSSMKTSTTDEQYKRKPPQLPNERANNKTIDPINHADSSSSSNIPGDLALKSNHIQNSKRPLFKSVLVNSAAARRHQQEKHHLNYGLEVGKYPSLAADLDRFWDFLTRPSPFSQEEPIRPATAIVYMRHVKLYFGWYLKYYNKKTNQEMEHDDDKSNKRDNNVLDVSLHSILPSHEQQAVTPFIEFVLWLRSERAVAPSYEANVLRGLTKLVKFRFAIESSKNSSNLPGGSGAAGGSSFTTQNSYQDIPLVGELRKLHRVANRQQKLSPRSSNENLKWISWPEYLNVVQSCLDKAKGLLQAYGQQENHVNGDGATSALLSLPLPAQHKSSMSDVEQREPPQHDEIFTSKQREVAIALQKYLVLAIFACVPDRQRTIRELEVGKTLVFVNDEEADASFSTGDNTRGCWCIRHAPQDYKTGKTYGERPLLRLPIGLTYWINLFYDNWRNCLRPKTNTLFVQPRTGNSLTRDSVYQLVSRSCFERTGKRTNPHLLRDMIVTHIRDSSQASEKELEALALFMGHSIQMQRTSYDRRTLTRKIAPAIQLLEQVNADAVILRQQQQSEDQI